MSPRFKPRKKEKPRWCVTEMTIVDGLVGDSETEAFENYQKLKETRQIQFWGFNEVKVEKSDGEYA